MASLLDLAEARLRGLLDIPTKAARAVVNPTVFSGLLGGPTLPKEQGFAEAAFGLPARENMSVLDPTAASYMQGYSAGEPMAYLGMATPFAAPAAVAGAKAVAPKAGMALENYMAAQGLLQPLTAYHGTPHTIQGKFDISKVGTGEGAQAYGHGMYFAENPAVATEYANKLGYDYKYMGKTPKENSPTDLALRWLKNLDWDKEAAKAQWKNEGLGAKVIKAIDDINLEKVQKPGNLYKVDIPDEYISNMLDYDKPIKDQPQILKKIRGLIKDPDMLKTFDANVEKGITGANVYANYIPTGVSKFDLLKQRDNLLNKYMTKDIGMSDAVRLMNEKDRAAFSNIAQKIDDLKNRPKMVSQVLNDAGIKGIKYLDQGSRGQGGTSNFVVFDPSEVKILEKNKKKIEGLLD